MSYQIDRRAFLGRGLFLGGAAIALRRPRLAARPNRVSTTPIIITSHRNETGREGLRAAWEILSSGGSAVDAVEKATNVIEVDPEDTSVGYGGLPNEDGVIQLDASIMDGRTYNAGAVGALERIKTPSSVARLVMERTDHVFLVGAGALSFARKWGFQEESLMTDKARARHLRWREELSEHDDWGPPDHLKGDSAVETGYAPAGEEDFHYGTVNVLAVDTRGDVAGITSTSGLSWKLTGRVGDSPIIGAGLYVDNDVGAAGATGRGEDVIKSCASYYIVGRMRDGRSPQQACEDGLRMILSRYRRVNPDFIPAEKFVAVSREGEIGCAWMGIDGRPEMSVHDEAGLRPFEGSAL